MAPPSHRRPGFSRKAQYALFSGYVIAVAGIVAAALLVVAAQFDPRGFRAVQGVATDAASPFMRAGRAVARFFGATDQAIADYFNALSTNGDLRAEVDRSRTKLIQARVIEAQNRELRALLKLRDQSTTVVATARLIGSTTTDVRRIVIFAAGAGDGVAAGQAVRAANGLIGRVLNAGHFASRVLLITDPSSVVPVRIARDGTPAFVTGNGDGTVDIRGLNAGAQTFRNGDVLLTSGTGGLYPPDIPVAVVTIARGDTGTGRPIADPAGVDFAFALSIFQPDRPADPVPPATGIPTDQAAADAIGKHAAAPTSPTAAATPSPPPAAPRAANAQGNATPAAPSVARTTASATAPATAGNAGPGATASTVVAPTTPNPMP